MRTRVSIDRRRPRRPRLTSCAAGPYKRTPWHARSEPLSLWVSGVGLGWLDLLVALLFVAGLGLSLAGYTLGASDRARQLGVVAIGWNAFGLVLFGLLYAAG